MRRAWWKSSGKEPKKTSHQEKDKPGFRPISLIYLLCTHMFKLHMNIEDWKKLWVNVDDVINTMYLLRFAVSLETNLRHFHVLVPHSAYSPDGPRATTSSGFSRDRRCRSWWPWSAGGWWRKYPRSLHRKAPSHCHRRPVLPKVDTSVTSSSSSASAH